MIFLMKQSCVWIMHFTFILQGELCWPATTYTRCAGQVAWVTKFYIMVPYNCASSVWKCFMSAFWHLEFEAPARYLEYLSIWHMTQLLQVHTKNKSSKHMLTVERNSGNPLTWNKPHIHHKISLFTVLIHIEHNQLLAKIIHNKMW